MTNRELLQKILADKHIKIVGLYYHEIESLLNLLKNIFNVKTNCNIAITKLNFCENDNDLNYIDLYSKYDYIYFKSKGRNSRTIRKGRFNLFNEHDYINYRLIIVSLLKLDLDSNSADSLEELIEKLNNK